MGWGRPSVPSRLLRTVNEGRCVCELLDAVKGSQPNGSRHLKLTKNSAVVEEDCGGRPVIWLLVCSAKMSAAVYEGLTELQLGIGGVR